MRARIRGRSTATNIYIVLLILLTHLHLRLTDRGLRHLAKLRASFGYRRVLWISTIPAPLTTTRRHALMSMIATGQLCCRRTLQIARSYHSSSVMGTRDYAVCQTCVHSSLLSDACRPPSRRSIHCSQISPSSMQFESRERA